MKVRNFFIGLIIEILIILSFYVFYVVQAFKAWGEGAIALVAVPGSFLFLGAMVFFVSLADPKDREKIKKKWDSFCQWTQKNKGENGMLFLLVGFVVIFILYIITVLAGAA